MNPTRLILTLALIIFVSTTSGCLTKSITDEQIEESFQVWLDTPFVIAATAIQWEEIRTVEGAPRNLKYQDYLQSNERAAIEEFTTYRNILKVQLVEGTPDDIWESVGSKCARAFALACRDSSFLEQTYVCELRIMAEVEDKRDNFLVGELSFSNRLERITPDLYSPSHSNK